MQQPCWLLNRGLYGGNFQKLLSRAARRQLKSFRYNRETAAKFSAVHLPLKQRVSRTLLHSALSRSVRRKRLGHANFVQLLLKLTDRW